MARPKLSEELRKEKLHLSISPNTKKMLDEIRAEKNQSISELVEEYVQKEYRKLHKKAKKEVENENIETTD